TDAILTLQTDRADGGLRSFSQFFRYDGQERLVRQWSSVGQASDTNPNVAFWYRYATADQPASILINTLIDVQISGEDINVTSSDVREFQTAAGEPFATARRIDSGWTFGPLVTRNPNQAETKAYLRPTIAGSVDLTALNYTALLTNASLIS